MASIVRKLEKKGVIAMTLLTLVLIGTSCEDRIDNPAVHPSEGETVEVSLNIGFADEVDGATLSANTKAPNNSDGNKQTAFDMQLVPASQTRAATTVHPDKLYNLTIHQYNSTGGHLASTNNITSQAPGTLIADLTNSDDCQLLIIARGANTAVASLNSSPLSEVRKIMANAETIKAISATDGTDINNMPYLLFLPHVKIESGKIVSPEGTDVRLLLKRLAVGVTIDWTFSNEMETNGYTLSEVRLMQVPKDYRILPETETTDPTFGIMYPTSVSEFVDGFRLKGEELKDVSSQTFWMPANARGTRNDVTYPTYRNKNYAHSAATYVEFVVNNTNGNERLLYRAYLGGNTTNDFNLLENNNYHWTIKINKANYTTDPRIQLQDLSPVISTNLQTTSNCFMMQPGTNICFNPYKHEAGTNGWNTYLASNGKIVKEITKVEVLWQSKDAGTSGDLVMGYVAADDNHKNLVNLTDASDVEKARIHVKVPITSGGNAVIAAYNNNTIVWSWHIWISDYLPVGLTGNITEENRAAAIKTAQDATKGGMVQVYGGISWTASDGAFFNKVIMDRNLGAIRAGIQNNLLDAARTFGLLYQGGRKDPFFSSADGTANETKTIYDGDGIETEIKRIGNTSNGYGINAIQSPTSFIKSVTNISGYGWDGNKKTIHDPCPKGWRVPLNGVKAVSNEYHLITDETQKKRFLWAGFGSEHPTFVAQFWVPGTNTPSEAGANNNLRYYNGTELREFTDETQKSDIVGSGFVYTGGTNDKLELPLTNKSVFFPAVALREIGTGDYRTGGTYKVYNNTVYLWSCTVENNNMHVYAIEDKKIKSCHVISAGYGFSVRCVQERE